MEIKLEDVWFSYDGKVYVVESANITFKDQGIRLVMGPNGSGKTTLLKIAALLYRPSNGRVFINGVSYWDLSPIERERAKSDIVYVHDKPVILRGSLEYNVRLGLELRGLNNSDVVEELLKKYKLENLRKANAKNLSAGQKRIVSIIRALALKSKVLLLDEPFNNLDTERIEILLEDLRELSKTTNVVVATHYLTERLREQSIEVYEIIAGRIRKVK